MRLAFQDYLYHPSESTDENSLQDLITLIHRENLGIGPTFDSDDDRPWESLRKGASAFPMGHGASSGESRARFRVDSFDAYPRENSTLIVRNMARL